MLVIDRRQRSELTDERQCHAFHASVYYQNCSCRVFILQRARNLEVVLPLRFTKELLSENINLEKSIQEP